jgi:hypothetical protein
MYRLACDPPTTHICEVARTCDPNAPACYQLLTCAATQDGTRRAGLVVCNSHLLPAQPIGAHILPFVWRPGRAVLCCSHCLAAVTPPPRSLPAPPRWLSEHHCLHTERGNIIVGLTRVLNF